MRDQDEAGEELARIGDGPPDMSRLDEELVASARDRGIELTGDGALLTALTRQVRQPALEAEMSAHLGYDRHDPVGRGSGTRATVRPPRR